MEKIEKHQTGLQELWRYLNGIVKKRLSRGFKAPERSITIDYHKWNIIYLKNVDCDKIGKNKYHKDRLKKLRNLILLAYERKIGTSNLEYWSYKHSSASLGGQYKDADKPGNIQFVMRSRKKNAFTSFKMIVNTKINKGSAMPSILKAVEADIFNNTMLLIRWLQNSQSMADADLQEQQEIKYIEEMIRLGIKSNHVYSMYYYWLKKSLENSRKNNPSGGLPF